LTLEKSLVRSGEIDGAVARQKQCDSNYSASTQLNTSTTVTADIKQNQTHTNIDTMTRSSRSSSDLATSASVNNIKAMTDQIKNNQNSKTCKGFLKLY
jgi:hypothetical protein